MDSRQQKRSTRFDMRQAQEPGTEVSETTTEKTHKAQKPPKRHKDPATEQTRAPKVLKGSPKPFVLPSIVESGGLGPVVQNGSAWNIYNHIFTCELAGTVSICEHRWKSSKVVAIRTTPKSAGKEMLKRYAGLHHFNIISASECFKNDGQYQFVVEDLPVSLEHLVACDAYPTEIQLASILKQVSFLNA